MLEHSKTVISMDRMMYKNSDSWQTNSCALDKKGSRIKFDVWKKNRIGNIRKQVFRI